MPSAEITRTEIRDRARHFSARFASASSEVADRQTFWNEFFAIFSVDRVLVAVFERLAKRSTTANRGWIDLLYPGQLAVEHKSRGEDLRAAIRQLYDYLPSLSKSELPWLLIACDFQTFRWENLHSGSSGTFNLADLADNVELFWWLAGHPSPNQTDKSEQQVNFEATAKMLVLHDELRENGFGGHELREWLTRILFCLFADDTGVWDNRGAFHTWIASMTRVDGSDLGPQLAYLFQILNTPHANRPKRLDEQISQFTYINGDLFAETLPVASCTERARNALLDACTFDWSAISPAIFGSMFQNVMKPAERHQLGAHYTTEENILKVIRPLFLDDLAEELQRADSKPKLRAFLDKIAKLTFLDPACGCGNFLVIAYRELRALETAALRTLRAKEGRTKQQVIDIAIECRVRVDQFYGIEVEEFPAKIARTALYLMDHLCNRAVSKEFGQHFARFPIPATPHITIANALSLDWKTLLPDGSASYIFGNPPFLGQSSRSPQQTADLRSVWGHHFARWLDYVSAWFWLAANYMETGKTRCAFVSTNSVTQGEQVRRIWQPMLSKGIVIDFAHRTFKWTSEAVGKAAVHCVIIGFSRGGSNRPRRLWQYEAVDGPATELRVDQINPYLLPRPNVLVERLKTPIGEGVSGANYGCKPADGGHLVIKTEAELPHADTTAMKFIRRYVGTDELIHGKSRWCVWIEGSEVHEASLSPFMRARVAAVKRFRSSSTAPDTKKAAEFPFRFFRVPQPTTRYIGIPRHVSEVRPWFTVDYLEADIIASDSIYTAVDTDGLLFGLLSSRMYITWLRNIGGAIKSDLRFSQLVHNSFPFPGGSKAQLDTIRKAGTLIINARNAHRGKSLAQLYVPGFMSPELVSAHNALDRAVEAVFSPRRRFTSDLERLEALFDAYVSRLGMASVSEAEDHEDGQEDE